MKRRSLVEKKKLIRVYESPIFPLSQVSKMPLDGHDLCDRYKNWPQIHLAMSDWEATNSPAVYWGNQINTEHYLLRYRTLSVASAFDDPWTNISFGLPTKEAVDVCRSINQFLSQINLYSEPNIL